jgi:hypothetical protein
VVEVETESRSQYVRTSHSDFSAVSFQPFVEGNVKEQTLGNHSNFRRHLSFRPLWSVHKALIVPSLVTVTTPPEIRDYSGYDNDKESSREHDIPPPARLFTPRFWVTGFPTGKLVSL